MKNLLLTITLFLYTLTSLASYILIPMDEKNQKNHLKAYGIAFWVLEQEVEVEASQSDFKMV